MEFNEFKLNEQGLIPAIVQRENGETLMLAWLDEQAYAKTMETGFMHYYSRSRQSLWKKGETSGNVQKVIRLQIDCDKDTLLAVVEQTGPACHTGQPTCFFTDLSA